MSVEFEKALDGIRNSAYESGRRDLASNIREILMQHKYGADGYDAEATCEKIGELVKFKEVILYEYAS